MSVFSWVSRSCVIMWSLVSAKSLRVVVTDLRVGRVGGKGGWFASFKRMESLVEWAAAHFVDMRSFACMQSIFGQFTLFASIMTWVVDENWWFGLVVFGVKVGLFVCFCFFS